MFTDYRVKFFMRDIRTNKKAFMVTRNMRTTHDGHDKEEAKVNKLTRLHQGLVKRHAPRFRPQLFACYEAPTVE